jgi:phosphocarrier protein
MRQTACFEIVNRLGLHARAAALLAETANRFQAEVKVSKKGQTVDAKSVMDLLLLAAARGSMIEVTAEGADAAVALEAIGELVAHRFNEED